MDSFRAKRFAISNFVCPQCNNMIPLPRPHKQREKDHKKNIYCPYCDSTMLMTEIRSCDKDMKSF